MMTITFEIETEEDLEMLRNFFAQGRSANAERQKRYRERKKCNDAVTECNETVTNRNETVTQDKEEREGKEEVLPLSSPSSLLSSPPHPPINYPITPFNPPLPEEREEREEKTFLAVGSKRGQLIGFGEHGHVKLSQKEYDGLVKKWGEEKTKRMIQNMDDYLEEDPKRLRKYETRNHNLTLQNWDRMDNERRQKQEKPREKTFGDIRREMESQSQDSFIESFWR